MALRTGGRAQAVEEEDTYAGEREQTFSGPFFGQHRWHHRQRRERSVFGVGVHCSERDESLAGPAFCNHCAFRNVMASPTTIKWPRAKPKCIVLNAGRSCTGSTLNHNVAGRAELRHKLAESAKSQGRRLPSMRGSFTASTPLSFAMQRATYTLEGNMPLPCLF